MDRRKFLVNLGRAACGIAIGGVAYKLVGQTLQAEGAVPKTRHAWAINTAKCTACGICETACVRTPSAVKAVNDQQRCSNCVVCYGHISTTEIDSEKIMSEGPRVCKYDAVVRQAFQKDDGFFVYSIDDNKCTACGKCVLRCGVKGSKSMFLIIRPDLCLGCNSCNIAAKCPSQAIEKVLIHTEDDLRNEEDFF